MVPRPRGNKDGGCFIKFRYYKSFDDLKKGNFAQEHEIERSISVYAEGTPSFENVQIQN